MKALLVAAAILALPASASAQGNEVRADASSNGRVITVRRNQYLTVTVDACVGCPYGWRLMRMPANLSLAGMRDVDTTNRGGPNPIVGGGKKVVYTFLVESAGRGQLVLENRRFQGPRDREAEMLRINVATTR